MNWYEKIIRSGKVRNGLGIIITAAVLLELITVIQYLYTRNMLESELENRAENEMVMKAILIKGMLNMTETAVRGQVLNVQDNLSDADGVTHVINHLMEMNPNIMSCGLAFRPDFYSSKGHLYEPFACLEDGVVMLSQIAGPDHDYTTMDFYKKALDSPKGHWSDPYPNATSEGALVTSYSMPVNDKQGQFACVLAIDLALDWFSDTLNARHAFPSSFDLLLTEGGTLICKPNESHPCHADAEQVARLINDSTVKKESSLSGHTRVIKFHSENGNGDGWIFFHYMKGVPHWQLAVVCYDNEVYGKFDRMQMIILLTMLGALLLLIFIILRFASNARKLHYTTLEQERIGSELRIASGLQMSMLPVKNHDLISRTDVDICGLLTPAVEVGGDLYDFDICDEKLFFCIGDVSGKGVPSALVMAVVHAMFASQISRESNPARIMQDLNEAACRNNNENMFVTFFIGVLDLPSGRLRYCNAGHDVPVIVGNETRMLPVDANLPIGVFANHRYTTQEIILEPGTDLFLYTDGLTEAMDINHEQFGSQRLMDALVRCKHNNELAPEQLLHSVNLEVQRFVDEAPQSDDLTMLAIRYTPVFDEDLEKDTLLVLNDLKQVPRLNEFVAQITGRMGLDAANSSQIKLAVEEAVVNVMNYAYPVGIQGDITVEAMFNNRVLKFRIIDSGKSFDPTKAASVDTSLSVEDRPIGGLGIFLVRELMDSINYERIDDKNILTLTKLFNTNQNQDEDKD